MERLEEWQAFGELKLKRRATMSPSAWRYADFGARAKAEDRKLRKDLTFGGPCFEGTLQKPTGVSESSPVAGTIEEFQSLYSLDAGRAREMHKLRPTSHTLSVHCL